MLGEVVMCMCGYVCVCLRLGQPVSTYICSNYLLDLRAGESVQSSITDAPTNTRTIAATSEPEEPWIEPPRIWMERQALIHMEPLNIVYHLHWPWQHRARWNQAPSLQASAPV